MAAVPGNATAGDGAIINHIVVSNPIDANTYRIVIYSPDNSPLTNGILAEIPFAIDAAFLGTSPVNLVDSKLSSAVPAEIPLSNFHNGTLTTVEDVMLEVLRGWNLFSFAFDPDPAAMAEIFASSP